MEGVAHDERSPRDGLRAAVGVLTYGIVMWANGSAGSGSLSGESVGVVANRYRSDFLPADWVFGIWGFIYLSLLAFTVYQALPKVRSGEVMRRLGWWWPINGLLNIAWIVTFSFSRFWLAMAIMLLLLGCLIVMHVRIGPVQALRWRDRAFISFPFDLYLAWISVAVIANTFQLVTYAQWSGFGIPGSMWSAVMMVVATGLAVFMAWHRGSWIFPPVVSLALYGIAARYPEQSLMVATARGMVGVSALTLLLMPWARKRWAAPALAGLALLCSFVTVQAGPNRYGHSDRVERHMLPAVSTGPQDPAWSPDGRWIAFSMRGDLWKIPSGGGEAIALTHGPHYYFEPRWSRDGRMLAFSMDVDGNLDIGIVGSEGGAVRRITAHPEVDVQPEWAHDGGSLYFVSARERGFATYSVDLDMPEPEGGTARRIAAGIQPALSPDGTELAMQGGGGLAIASADGSGALRVVRREETAYRMRPAWAPDGRAIFYVSDERGSNDVVVIPTEGGSPVRITADTLGEFSPSVSPDGRRIVFVSNRTGPTALHTAPVGGGPYASWATIAVDARRPHNEEGTVRVTVRGADGARTPARIHVRAADGRGYAPRGAYHRVISVSETHYFHTDGSFEIEVPVGPLRIEASRGPEYRPATADIEVRAGVAADLELSLERMVDLPARGWYSGDTHLHDLHQGRFGLTHEDFFLQTQAEDLHVANALIHMDGTRLMGRWDDLTGVDHPLSTATHILRYGQEFRGQLGHISMLGVRTFVLPFISGTGGTVYAAPSSDLPYLDGARDQGGLAGYNHPFINRVDTPERLAGSAVPMDIALGRGDFYDVAAVYSDELYSTDVYYRILNAGFRLPATGGTDNFSDVWRDPPPGADRTYVQIDGPLTFESWMDGIRAHRTFGSTGPILLMDVAGRSPGSEVALAGEDAVTLPVNIEMWSIAEVERIEVVANGRVVHTESPPDGHAARLQIDVDLPEGGWIAARAVGGPSPWVTDSYAFAQTSPVYVVREGRRWTSADDARFLADAVRAMKRRVEGAAWRGDEDRVRFFAEADRAIEVYEEIARR